tara:strand:+ start:344 stop:481 length:138 start_codon:yes stop_codon:yes gene_type:complete
MSVNSKRNHVVSRLKPVKQEYYTQSKGEISDMPKFLKFGSKAGIS